MFKQYVKEIFNLRSVLLGLWLPIIIFFVLDNIKIAELYKFNISLAILCIIIPIAWYKTWKKYYEKSLSKIPENYNKFLKNLSHTKPTNLTIATNESDKLSMINELVDDGYISDYKHNYNQNTKSYTHRIKLTTLWKKYLEGRL